MSRAGKAGLLLALLLVSVLVLGSFFRVGGVDARTDLRHPFSHGIPRPFAYRCLPPVIISGLLELIPAPVLVAADRLAKDNPQARKLCRQYGWAPDAFADLLVTGAVLLAALLGFSFALGYLLDQVYVTSPTLRWAVRLAGVAVLPVMFRYASYVYDLPYLALYTLALGLMSARRWTWYLLVLGLNTLTKETSVLLVLVFILHFRRRLPVRRYAALLGMQVGIYAALASLVRWCFRSNIGQPVEFHLGHNLTLGPFGLGTGVALGVLVVAGLYEWHEKPTLLLDGLWCLAPLLAACLFCGLLDEYRDYYEVYPVGFLLVFHTAIRVLGYRPFGPRQEEPAQAGHSPVAP